MASDGTFFLHNGLRKGKQEQSFQILQLHTTTVLYKWSSTARVTLYIRTTRHVFLRAGHTGGLDLALLQQTLLIYNRLPRNCMSQHDLHSRTLNNAYRSPLYNPLYDAA